jgi:hypothetical protein
MKTQAGQACHPGDGHAVSHQPLGPEAARRTAASKDHMPPAPLTQDREEGERAEDSGHVRAPCNLLHNSWQMLCCFMLV